MLKQYTYLYQQPGAVVQGEGRSGKIMQSCLVIWSASPPTITELLQFHIWGNVLFVKYLFFFSVEYYLCLGCVFPRLPVIRSPTFFVSLVCRVCAVVSQCLSFLFYFDSLSPRLFCFPSYSLITQLPSCSVFLSYLLCHPVCLPECFSLCITCIEFLQPPGFAEAILKTSIKSFHGK